MWKKHSYVIKLQKYLIINIFGRDQAMSQIFCTEIETTERNRLKVILLFRNTSTSVKACQNLSYGNTETKTHKKMQDFFISKGIDVFSKKCGVFSKKCYFVLL